MPGLDHHSPWCSGPHLRSISLRIRTLTFSPTVWCFVMGCGKLCKFQSLKHFGAVGFPKLTATGSSKINHSTEMWFYHFCNGFLKSSWSNPQVDPHEVASSRKSGSQKRPAKSTERTKRKSLDYTIKSSQKRRYQRELDSWFQIWSSILPGMIPSDFQIVGGSPLKNPYRILSFFCWPQTLVCPLQGSNGWHWVKATMVEKGCRWDWGFVKKDPAYPWRICRRVRLPFSQFWPLALVMKFSFCSVARLSICSVQFVI